MATPPLVLLHGFTGSPRSFHALRAALDRPCVAPLLPGHGPRPGPVHLAEAFAVVDEATGGGSVDLLGYSLGGRIALHYAFERPERVRRLILLGARPGLSDPAERQARLAADRALADDLRREGLERFLDRWAALPLLAPVTTDAERLAALGAIRRGHTAQGLAGVLEHLSVAALPDRWPELPRLRPPSVWVAGAEDATYRPMMAQAAARCGGRFEVIAGAGHMLLVDAPEAVARLV